MENNLDKLIGAQLVSINEYSLVVNMKGEIITLSINSNDGDCCGYAEVKANLYCELNSNRNPIITDIKLVNSESGYGEIVTLVLYGENKELASIEAEAGSGSGYSYGACVWLECKNLNIDQILVEY